MSKYFTVSKAEARELKRRSEGMDPVAVAGSHSPSSRTKWLAKLGTRAPPDGARAYDGSAREAKKLLECILVAEEEGLPDVADIRRELAQTLGRKRAA